MENENKDSQSSASEAKPAAAVPKSKPDPRSKLWKPEGRPLLVSSSPHFHAPDSVPKIMWTVSATLIPAVVMGVIYFGIAAALMITACIVSAVVTEVIADKMKGKALTIGDGSAVLTGLLLALTLPPSLNISAGILGSVFAIAIGKQVFGGLGYNIFNPALLGRAFLQASFPVAMTTWTYPGTQKYSQIDAVTAATPLGQFKFEKILTSYGDLFVGNIGGCIGETSAIAILAGALILLLLKYADWRIPVGFLGTVFILGSAFWIVDPKSYPDPVFHILAGGLMIGALYMATDMVTSPITPLGTWIYAVGCGIFLVVIRLFGGLPEGVMYAILLMNGFTPLINRKTRPRIFGEVNI
jgi:electron transport complex protein RnfD